MKNKYAFNWVLKNKIAISSLPKFEEDYKLLKKNGIRNSLCLCNENEVPDPNFKDDFFSFKRYKLPDHKVNEIPKLEQISQVIEIVDNLLEKGPLLIHCFAGIERSPLICMAWLIKRKKLSLLNAYEYLKYVHPQSCPLSSHLDVIKGL